jgi:hypothetical protein
MTTSAGTAYRRTVGVAGEATVGRATALVAVVKVPGHGLRDELRRLQRRARRGADGRGAVRPPAAVFPATRPLWLRHRKSLCHADRRSQSSSSAFANRRSRV